MDSSAIRILSWKKTEPNVLFIDPQAAAISFIEEMFPDVHLMHDEYHINANQKRHLDADASSEIFVLQRSPTENLFLERRRSFIQKDFKNIL